MAGDKPLTQRRFLRRPPFFSYKKKKGHFPKVCMRGKGARSERLNLFHCFVINWKVYPHGKTFFPKQGRSMDRGASKDFFLSPPCPVPTHALRVYMCTSYILLEPQAVFFLYQKNTPGLIPSKKKKKRPRESQTNDLLKLYRPEPKPGNTK